MFARVVKNTPLFNCKNFPDCFQYPLKFDHRYLLNELETVLYKDSVVEVLQVTDCIAEVKTKEYPSEKRLYLDTRFLEFTESEPMPREIPLSTKRQILAKLENFPKCIYIWGGTDPKGVPSWSTYYPPTSLLTPFEMAHWHFKGVDCSGLLYNVTNGATPRNTRELRQFGTKVGSLRPLDLVLYPGHVMIVLSKDKMIESRHLNGLAITNLKDRLKECEHLEDLEYRRWF